MHALKYLMIFWNASSSYLSEQLLLEQLINPTRPEIYPAFSDPVRYAGKVPTGHYMATTKAEVKVLAAEIEAARASGTAAL